MALALNEQMSRLARTLCFTFGLLGALVRCGGQDTRTPYPQPSSGGLAGSSGADGALVSKGGSGGKVVMGSTGGLGGNSLRPIAGDPEFRGCFSQTRCEGPSCPPGSPTEVPPENLRSGSPSLTFVANEPQRAQSAFDISAGDIEWRVAPDASPFATMTWNGMGYDAVTLSSGTELLPGASIFVSAEGDLHPAFSGELVVPAKIELTYLPAEFTIGGGSRSSGPDTGAGGAEGVEGQAGTSGEASAAPTAPSNVWRFEWSAQGDAGLVELSLTNVFKPDAHATISSAFCRVPVSDGSVEIVPFSFPGRTQGTIRVVTLSGLSAEPLVPLFGVRDLAAVAKESF